MEGFVTLHRKIQEWKWYQNSKMVHLFVHLILSANHAEGYWQGTHIKRGQLITGRLKLSKTLGFSEQELRTCLSKLKSTNEITIESTNSFSLITINKYDYYQSKERKSTSKSTIVLTNDQPTVNQPLTTNNNDNNDNKDNKKKKVSSEKLKSFSYTPSIKELIESSLAVLQKNNKNYSEGFNDSPDNNFLPITPIT